MVDHRLLKISYSPDQREKYTRFRKEAKAFGNEFNQRNVKIKRNLVKGRSELFLIELYGYDGLLKYQTNKVGERALQEIIKKIDKMPMGKIEKKSFDLYTNAHPEKTIKGTGFRDEATARRTIKLVEKSGRDARGKYLVIHAMFYRAKYHPHQTPEMRAAMKIFQSWISKHR